MLREKPLSNKKPLLKEEAGSIIACDLSSSRKNLCRNWHLEPSLRQLVRRVSANDKPPKTNHLTALVAGVSQGRSLHPSG
jgi:hypothetical protein